MACTRASNWSPKVISSTVNFIFPFELRLNIDLSHFMCLLFFVYIPLHRDGIICLHADQFKIKKMLHVYQTARTWHPQAIIWLAIYFTFIVYQLYSLSNIWIAQQQQLQQHKKQFSLKYTHISYVHVAKLLHWS